MPDLNDPEHVAVKGETSPEGPPSSPVMAYSQPVSSPMLNAMRLSFQAQDPKLGDFLAAAEETPCNSPRVPFAEPPKSPESRALVMSSAKTPSKQTYKPFLPGAFVKIQSGGFRQLALSDLDDFPDGPDQCMYYMKGLLHPTMVDFIKQNHGPLYTQLEHKLIPALRPKANSDEKWLLPLHLIVHMTESHSRADNVLRKIRAQYDKGTLKQYNPVMRSMHDDKNHVSGVHLKVSTIVQ